MQNRISKHFTSAFILAFGLLVPCARGLEVPVEKDTRLEQANPTANYGGASDLGVRWVSGANIKWTVLHFSPDFYLPWTRAEDISSAYLRIYVNAVTQPGSVKLVRVMPLAWTEGTLDGVTSGVSTDLCFNNRPNGFDSMTREFSQAHVNQFYTIDITNWVKSWVYNPTLNNGIILFGDTTVDVTFDAKENTARGHAPKLDIVINKVRVPARGDVTMGTFTNGTAPE